jgi:acyl carrier protein
MNDEALFAKLTEIFREVFDDDEITLNAETTAEDIEGWDSISNIQLLVAIEQAFTGVKFSTGEVANMKNVGEMVEALRKKTGD